VGLYVHIPFCRAICTYCAFAKGEFDPAAADAWLEALAAEITHRERATWDPRPRLDTVFLGGGTPTALGPERILRLGDLLRRSFRLAQDCEFTSEANPESFTPETARALREAGANRISLGAQSFDSRELAMLGRIHDAEAPGRAVGLARDSGFTSVSLDLMFALPGQTPESFARNLTQALDLLPDHLSAYCLGLEPGTGLTLSVREGAIPAPEDGAAREMYEHLVEATADRGLELYEISNFARPGHACRHNLRYWRRQDVLALGPSSHALAAGRRWVNPAPLNLWAGAYGPRGKAPEPREVPGKDARFEYVFLNLRLAGGLDLGEYQTLWNEPFEGRYGQVLRRLVRGGMILREGDRIRLAPGARFLSDGVFSEFAS